MKERKDDVEITAMEYLRNYHIYSDENVIFRKRKISNFIGKVLIQNTKFFDMPLQCIQKISIRKEYCNKNYSYGVLPQISHL